MNGAIRSELRKFFTTRMWWGMAIAVFLAGAAFAALFALLLTGNSVRTQAGRPLPAQSALDIARQVYTGGLGVSYLLTLAIGVTTIGSEYRHQTITSTFLATPKRVRVMLAKVVALLGVGAFYGLVSLVGSVGVGAVILSIKGRPAFPDASLWRTLALSLLVLGLWALIGLGAGILIPNQVAALLITVGVAWIVEPILGAVLTIWAFGRTISPYLPTNATQAVVGGSAFGGTQSRLLAWWAGALVLTAYAVVMAAVGSSLTVRRDVT